MHKPISPSVNIKRLASDLHKQAFIYNQSRVSNQNSDGSPSLISPVYLKGTIGSNVIGIKSQKRYLSIMGAGVNSQNTAVEPFGDEMKVNKNTAYVHKR